MRETTKPTIAQSLETIKQEVQYWRSTRQKVKPMPEELWQTAAQVARKSSVGKVAKQLGLNYTALKNRVARKKSKKLSPVIHETGFIELGTNQPPGIEASCEVELERACGSKLRIKFTPNMGINIAEIWRGFLQQS